MTPSELGPSVRPPVTGRRRTHPLTVVLGVGGVVLGLLFSFVLGADLLGLVLGVFGALRFVGWFFRTYELRADDMVIAGGVFTRHEQVVPYQRVQQIDFHRSLVAQALGLTELRIDTAGSKQGRVQLAYLEHPLAESIREWVLARRAGLAAVHAAPSDGTVPVPHTQLSLSEGRLLLAGATSTAPFVALAFFITAMAVVAPVALGGRDAAVAVLIGGSGAATLVAVVTVASALGHLVTYARFRVSLVGDDLRVDYGLFEVQHLTMPRARVQHVSIVDNPIRRALGLLSVTLHSAAVPGAEHATRFKIVAMPRDRVGEVLSFALPRAHGPWRDLDLEARPPAARRRAVVRRTVLIAIPAIVAAIAFFPVGLLSLAAAALGIPWGATAHRRAGHAVSDATAVFAAGVVSHRVQIVPVARVQSSRTAQSPFQRRSDLATLALDVAGSAPRLYDMDATTAARLRATVPFQEEERL
jgi:putative membrane protein